MQLITLIIFIIILIIPTLLSIILILTSVTSYNLQHVFVSRDKWSSVGHAEIYHHCNHRRRHHSQIIKTKKNNLQVETMRGLCRIASHQRNHP